MSAVKSQMSPELEFAQLEINAKAHAQAFVAKEIKVSTQRTNCSVGELFQV